MLSDGWLHRRNAGLPGRAPSSATDPDPSANKDHLSIRSVGCWVRSWWLVAGGEGRVRHRPGPPGWSPGACLHRDPGHRPRPPPGTNVDLARRSRDLLPTTPEPKQGEGSRGPGQAPRSAGDYVMTGISPAAPDSSGNPTSTPTFHRTAPPPLIIPGNQTDQPETAREPKPTSNRASGTSLARPEVLRPGRRRGTSPDVHQARGPSPGSATAGLIRRPPSASIPWSITEEDNLHPVAARCHPGSASDVPGFPGSSAGREGGNIAIGFALGKARWES